jgi:hypothetical protein
MAIIGIDISWFLIVNIDQFLLSASNRHIVIIITINDMKSIITSFICY